MKYTPSDYAQILYGTKDVDALIELLRKHWVLPWLPKILECFEELSRKKEGIVEMSVKSAHPIEKKMKEEIIEMVEKVYRGKKLEVNFTLDKGIIGGFRAESDEIVIPASLVDRMEQLNLNLES